MIYIVLCLKVFLYLCLIYCLFELYRDINFDKFGESVDYFNNNYILYVFGEYEIYFVLIVFF